MSEATKIIGGHLPLELPAKSEYHRNALRLNSGRYCLDYVLRVRTYRKVYLPTYICDSVLQPVRRLKIDCDFYFLDEAFAPIFDREPEKDAGFLYVNYFGLNGARAQQVCRSLRHVIIDNTQAFFERPLPHVDTLYSPRKFFGVPDGGYLYTDAERQLPLERDPSYYRCDALLKQLDLGMAAAEPLFAQNEAYLDTCGPYAMSYVTQRLLAGIDYPQVRRIRNENFSFLHRQLELYNELKLNFSVINGPLCYPFLCERGEELKNLLLDHGIYANDYWPEVSARVPAASFEHRLAQHLIALPIDQRYGAADMETIGRLIRKFLNG